MEPREKIKGKRVLIVDDEKDVLDVLEQLLDVCRTDSAYNFNDAEELIKSNDYDFAILDIMGVDGFKLLELTNRKGIPTLMLTAHALSPQDLKKSAQDGASYYVPKERIDDIVVFIVDVLDAMEKKINPWTRCFQRLGAYYDKIFGGSDWRLREKEFWEKKLESIPRI
jgi:DNA-binding NtrC family response regulator